MEVVIFGTSKVAQSIFCYAQQEADFHVAGFCIDAQYRDAEQYGGVPVVLFDEVEKHFPPSRFRMLVAIGYHQMNKVREQRCIESLGKGYELANYISPRACLAPDVVLGRNCIVMANATIEPHARLGDHVCVFNNSSLAHDVIAEDNVWVGSGVVVAGGTRIGHHSFIGVGATLGHNIEIGAECFIGAGALVTKNTAPKSVYIAADTPKYRLDTDQFLRLTHFH